MGRARHFNLHGRRAVALRSSGAWARHGVCFHFALAGTMTTDELRQSLEGPPRGRRRDRWSGASLQLWFSAVVVVGMLTAIAVIWIWTQGRENRAIEALPDAERRALYSRTLEDLRTVCATSHSSDLDLHCEAQARFILKFPECDAACQRLARWQLPHPTR
jgi:cytochrome b pre-mRNA-processing protein 3